MLGLVKQSSRKLLKKKGKKSKSNLVQQPLQATAESTAESSSKVTVASALKPVPESVPESVPEPGPESISKSIPKSAAESTSEDEILKKDKVHEKISRQEISDITSVEDKSRRTEKKKRRKREKVAVVNANGDEGASIVRTLAKKKFDVLAIVRVSTSRYAKSFLGMKNVKIAVADSLFDSEAIAKLIKGCKRIFFVTEYWERFGDKLEETQAFTIFKACGVAKTRKVVFSTYEDVGRLTEKGLKSQIISYGGSSGLKPTFDGMKDAMDFAKSMKIQVIHMITSYFNQETSKRSICMIANDSGDLTITSKLK